MSTPSPWKYFSEEELKCKHCGQMHMDDTFMRRIVALRKKCGFPFKITSGYRCPVYNNQISHTGLKGPHTTGHAIDIQAVGAEALEIVSLATSFGITGVGIKQNGTYSGRFIHLDDLPQDLYLNRYRPHIWTY